MKVIVSGVHMDVGASLTAYIEEQLTNQVSKYFENAINARVVISKLKQHSFESSITINECLTARA